MKDHTPLDKRALASFLAERLEHYKVPSFYSETDKLHRTYNGNLNRNYYNNFINKG